MHKNPGNEWLKSDPHSIAHDKKYSDNIHNLKFRKIQVNFKP